MSDKDGIDLVGLGKVAKAIPPDVYKRTTRSALATFEKLIAPITESTDGLGRYIRQKFDGMVEVEKALAVYALERAVEKARAIDAPTGKHSNKPVHPKSFTKAIEEASRETDHVLHEMWTSLIAAQITDTAFHPHFVEILPHFSPAEAQLLQSLLPRSRIGPNGGGYFWAADDAFQSYVTSANDPDVKPWTYSCALLCEFRFADVVGPKKGSFDENVTILFRTTSGSLFLEAVSR